MHATPTLSRLLVGLAILSAIFCVVERLLGNGRAVPVLLLGLNPLLTASTAPVLTVYAVLLHANVNWDFGPLGGVIASPVFHRWHHSRDPAAIDKNFAGLFPVLDILFGTYYMPRDRVPENFRIHEPMLMGYPRQLVYPFAVASVRAKDRTTRELSA